MQEIVAVLAAQLGDIVEARLTAAQPPSSGDSVTMSRASRSGYRGTIGALAAVAVAAVTWGVAQVQAYGDSRESAAKAAIGAEQKAIEAARDAQETRQVAESAAAHAVEIDRKLDRVLAKLEQIEAK